MIGAIVGGAMAAAGSIFGGIKASQAMQKARRSLQSQKDRNEDWYNRRYNEDATQRADAQRILTKTEEAIRSRNRAAAGTAAVMGTGAEAAAAEKAANSAALADAASAIAAQGAERKDQIENQYMQREGQLDDQLNAMEAQKAMNIAQAVQGVAQAGGSIASSFNK